MTLNVLKSTTVGKPVKELQFQYKNWRGETSLRTIIPIEIWYGKTEWHPLEQWFIKAIDLEKGEERDFALVDIKFFDGTN
ncbi:hypothetical protein JJB09_11290 [Rhizobium sp. KVB221]|uniref:WYL domain-containing protein n=1 Tax=Rhizobium setariae TaxID=2801340 RepID=A0A936YTP4_9HYPH|nr:hypothetical protein [Rhizobium setariae]MBL0372612.1 hypothetical protein [Rhizobium setariae]